MSPKPIDFSGRVVIVTGAGSGLGSHYALELGRRGAAVIVNDLGTSIVGSGSSTQPADTVVNKIREAGGTAAPSYHSVATAAGGRAIVADAMTAFNRVDCVINNAGSLRNAPFEELSDDVIDAMIDVHLKGAFNVTRPAYRLMKQQGYGRIVFTASSVATYGNETQTAYGAAKAGLIGLTNCLANEAKAQNIRVNVVLPTGMTRLADAMDPKNNERTGAVFADAGAAIGDSMHQRFVVPLVVYLASESCRYTQGVFSGAMGRFAQSFSGIGAGWQGPLNAPATAEDVEAHFPQICSRDGYIVPTHITDEYTEVIRRLRIGPSIRQ